MKSKYALPHLNLNSESTHVSKGLVDNIFDCLVESFPEEILQIEKIDNGQNVHPVDIEDSYFKVINFIFEHPKAFPAFEKNEIVFIELMFELWRRYRAMMDFSEPEIRGVPLALSLTGPFPVKLDDKPISIETANLGMTQEIVDRYVDAYYAKNKEWCYIQGEAWRRGLVIFHVTGNWKDRFMGFPEIFPELAGSNARAKVSRLRIEAADRIRVSCKCK